MNTKALLKQSALWATYEGLTTAYLTAFALVLGANNTLIGFLGAIPWIATLISQIPGSELAERYKRTTIYIIFTLIGRLCWIPILAAPFITQKPLLFVAAFYLIARISETITDPSWASIVADIVPQKHLGEFSSKRYLRLSLFAMIAMAIAGQWLKLFPKESTAGFTYLFLAGILFGIAATLMMKKIKEPKCEHQQHSLKEFFTLDGNLKKLVVFGTAFNFAFMFASPFFAVYMLKNLEISYAFYGIAISITPITQAIVSRYVGRLTDKYGDKYIALMGCIGTAIVPLMYLLVTKNNLWLLIPVQIISGIVWATTDIARFNLIIGLTDAKKRAMQIAEYQFYTSTTMIAGPILGGYLSEHFVFVLAGIPLIFVLSSIMRFLSALLLLRVKEVRAKKEYSFVFVLTHAINFHPNRGIEKGVNVVKRIANNVFYK